MINFGIAISKWFTPNSRQSFFYLNRKWLPLFFMRPLRPTTDEVGYMKNDSGDNFPDRLKVDGVRYRGYGNIPKYVMFDLDLTLEAKAIYAYFSSFAGRGNTAFPSVGKILKDLLVSENTYYHHFCLLTKQGYIITTQTKENGKLKHNIYTMPLKPSKFFINQLDPKIEEKYAKIRQFGLEKLGYGTIPKAVMQDDRIKLKAKGIYAFFASLCGDKDYAYPKRKDILFYLHINKETFYIHLNMLIDLGYITPNRRHVDGLLGETEYRLNDAPDLYTEHKKHRVLTVTLHKKKSEKSVCNQCTENCGMAIPQTLNNQRLSQCTENQCTENQCTENQCTENQCTENQCTENQCTENQCTENQCTENCGTVISKTLINQGFDQCPENQCTENCPPNNNSIEYKQIILINQSVLKRATASRLNEGLNEIPSAPIHQNQKTELKGENGNCIQRPTGEDIKIAVHTATNYENICKQYADSESMRNEFGQAVFRLFNNALITMLSSNYSMINKQKVKAEDVRAKFDECVSASHSGKAGVLDMQSLIRVSIDGYEKGQQFNIGQGVKIKNALRYMQACIWQALLVGLADPQIAAQVRNKELSDIIPLASGQYQRKIILHRQKGTDFATSKNEITIMPNWSALSWNC